MEERNEIGTEAGILFTRDRFGRGEAQAASLLGNEYTQPIYQSSCPESRDDEGVTPFTICC